MMIQQLLLVIHMLICLGLIGLVLIQHGKGADVGAAFGSGASGTVFGSRGSGSFLFKITGCFAIIFFASSLYLGYLASHQGKPQSIIQTGVQTSQMDGQDIPKTV